jgi:hypothetical protein
MSTDWRRILFLSRTKEASVNPDGPTSVGTEWVARYSGPNCPHSHAQAMASADPGNVIVTSSSAGQHAMARESQHI